MIGLMGYHTLKKVLWTDMLSRFDTELWEWEQLGSHGSRGIPTEWEWQWLYHGNGNGSGNRAMGMEMNSHCSFSQYYMKICWFCSVIRELAKHSHFTFTIWPDLHPSMSLAHIVYSYRAQSEVIAVTWMWKWLKTLTSQFCLTRRCCQSCSQSHVDCCARPHSLLPVRGCSLHCWTPSWKAEDQSLSFSACQQFTLWQTNNLS